MKKLLFLLFCLFLSVSALQAQTTAEKRNIGTNSAEINNSMSIEQQRHEILEAQADSLNITPVFRYESPADSADALNKLNYMGPDTIITPTIRYYPPKRKDP